MGPEFRVWLEALGLRVESSGFQVGPFGHQDDGDWGDAFDGDNRDLQH